MKQNNNQYANSYKIDSKANNYFDIDKWLFRYNEQTSVSGNYGVDSPLKKLNSLAGNPRMQRMASLNLQSTDQSTTINEQPALVNAAPSNSNVKRESDLNH